MPQLARPAQPTAPEPVAEAAPAQPSDSKPLPNRQLIEQHLHRPYMHHQAENLISAVFDMMGPNGGSTPETIPGHIANRLQSIKTYHEDV